jgi:hypothetical protein
VQLPDDTIEILGTLQRWFELPIGIYACLQRRFDGRHVPAPKTFYMCTILMSNNPEAKNLAIELHSREGYLNG